MCALWRCNGASLSDTFCCFTTQSPLTYSSTSLPTHTPCLFWVRLEQFIWRWCFPLWQRHFYTTFSWGVRKYCSWKRRVEATEQIKDKNLPVRKISVSLNEKFLEVPMSCFALRKSWRGKIQINEHKIEKLDFRPGWYLWRLSVLESGLHFCSWTCFLAYLAPTCNPIYSVTSKMASGLSLHHTEEVGNFGVKFTVVTALTCWKQL